MNDATAGKIELHKSETAFSSPKEKTNYIPFADQQREQAEQKQLLACCFILLLQHSVELQLRGKQTTERTHIIHLDACMHTGSLLQFIH